MSDNVIILGAGFSHAAGIPMMNGFVETMWQLAMRKSYNGKKLSPKDCAIFEEAEKVRQDLNGYHGRAHFDDRNIEDILSLLSFNRLGNDPRASKQLEAMNRAIGRTIELTCSVEHSIGASQTNPPLVSGPDAYRHIWWHLLRLFAGGRNLPTIITLNYDLVLERSLFQLLGSTYFDGTNKRFPHHHVQIRYHFENAPEPIFRIKYEQQRQFDKANRCFREGSVVEKTDINGSDSLLEIELLKLHGSLNFPSTPLKPETNYDIETALEEPYILPPIFNKFSGSSKNRVWEIALQRLREAKNIIVVGYSLPKTDIYMQYFLKAALGPNLNFNKFFVFDPVLYQKGEEMMARYSECFSPQLRKHICFMPEQFNGPVPGVGYAGSMNHFERVLAEHANWILF